MLAGAGRSQLPGQLCETASDARKSVGDRVGPAQLVHWLGLDSVEVDEAYGEGETLTAAHLSSLLGPSPEPDVKSDDIPAAALQSGTWKKGQSVAAPTLFRVRHSALHDR
jgi:hypothetical protein